MAEALTSAGKTQDVKHPAVDALTPKDNLSSKALTPAAVEKSFSPDPPARREAQKKLVLFQVVSSGQSFYVQLR